MTARRILGLSKTEKKNEKQGLPGQEALIHLLGWSGQGLYFGRTFGQWAASERKGQSCVPWFYWPLSLLAACLLGSYAALRGDAVILSGQAVNFLIYLRNLQRQTLQAKGRSLERGLPVWSFLLLLPVLAWLLPAPDVHDLLLLAGWTGQVLFLSRFPLQLYLAETRNEEGLPRIFWILSLAGSSLLILYAGMNRDWVILCGQSVGFLCYSRNLLFLQRKPATAG